MAALTDWTRQLQPAKFREAPFAVLGGESRFGRRTAPHEYPYRDVGWVEDLGRGLRRIGLVGFVVGNDAMARRDRVIQACETEGPGTLIHPSLGSLTVSLHGDLVVTERWDRGRYFELGFSFIESGLKQFPTATISTASGVTTSALAADLAAAAAFVSAADQSLRMGAAVIQQVERDVQAWVRHAQKLANDATNLFDLAVELPGNFGRYFGGGLIGFGNVTSAHTSVSTLPELVAQGAQSRASVATAAATLTTAAGQLTGNAAAENAHASAAQSLAAALLAACVNPSDALRLLAQLAQAQTSAPGTSSPLGAAIATVAAADGDLFRRAATVAVARASALYQPVSEDDAAAVRSTVCALLDFEITIAGDQGEDDSFATLRSLRASVALDLGTRGAALPPIVQFGAGQALPSLVWAQRAYRDASRSDQLEVFAQPVHPLFMPTVFRALAS